MFRMKRFSVTSRQNIMIFSLILAILAILAILFPFLDFLSYGEQREPARQHQNPYFFFHIGEALRRTHKKKSGAS